MCEKQNHIIFNGLLLIILYAFSREINFFFVKNHRRASCRFPPGDALKSTFGLEDCSISRRKEEQLIPILINDQNLYSV